LYLNILSTSNNSQTICSKMKEIISRVGSIEGCALSPHGINSMYVALGVHKTTIKSHIVANIDFGPVYLSTSILNLLKGCIDIFDGEGGDNGPTILTVAGRGNCRSKEALRVDNKKRAVEVPPLAEEIDLAHTWFLGVFPFILAGPAKDLLVEGPSTVDVRDWDL